MFERLTARGAALGEKVAARRRGELAAALREEAPAGVRVSEQDETVLLSGRGLALDRSLRWLLAGRGR